MSPGDVPAAIRAAFEHDHGPDVAVLIVWLEDEVQRLEVFRSEREGETAWLTAVAMFQANSPEDPIAAIEKPQPGDAAPPYLICSALSDTRSFQAVLWRGTQR